jgi:hypothetical protein
MPNEKGERLRPRENEISKDWKKRVLQALELEFAPP